MRYMDSLPGRYIAVPLLTISSNRFQMIVVTDVLVRSHRACLAHDRAAPLELAIAVKCHVDPSAGVAPVAADVSAVVLLPINHTEPTSRTKRA